MKRSRKLIWYIYPSYLLVVFASIFLLGWYFLRNFSEFQYQSAREELTRAANVFARHIQVEDIPLDSAAARESCDHFGAASGHRYTLVLASGKVAGDSDEDYARMENHADRPEVRAVLAGDTGFRERYSRTVRGDMLYVAVPVMRDGEIMGVARAAMNVDVIRTAMQNMRRNLVGFGLLLGLLATSATVVTTRRISNPLGTISRNSTKLEEGGVADRQPPSGIEEIDALAQSIDRMAERLHDRIQKVVRQRDEQNVLFACMTEGVLAVDPERRIIRMNAAARRLFDIADTNQRGRKVSEVVRHADLLAMIETTFQSEEMVEYNITIPERSIFLQAHGSLLLAEDGEILGALMVLSDVTQLRKLEVMRRDFVSNVSHELKTPITSIKGFLDTLLDTEDVSEGDRERFMDIISQQVNRLQSIVEDLLTFSNLEYEIDKGHIELMKTRIKPIIKNAVQTCSNKADSRNIELRVNVGQDLEGEINSQLLEQALINLIDNSIKYSAEQTAVDISAKRLNGSILIEVADEGIGIPPEHVNRIFERFYCVDKSRSRSMGGTGLGLAIVKHIAIAHHGRVEVESESGQGSRFRIIIPA